MHIPPRPALRPAPRLDAGSVERRQRLVGILLMLGAVLSFAGLDACAKWLNGVMHPLQTVGLRYLASLLFIAAAFNPWTVPGVLRTRRLGLQCGRAALLVVATLGAFTALAFLPLAEVASITFASPLVLALIAGPLLGERLGVHRVAAALAGFAGVLVITRPGFSGMHLAALGAVAAACANALYGVATRHLAAHDRPETTLLIASIVGSLIMLPALPLVWTTPAQPLVWVVIAVMGGFAAFGHWLLILAHRRAPASVLAPFLYAQLAGAVVLGLLVFGQVPDRWTLLGGSIVMASGLYLLYRERTAPAAE